MCCECGLLLHVVFWLTCGVKCWGTVAYFWKRIIDYMFDLLVGIQRVLYHWLVTQLFAMDQVHRLKNQISTFISMQICIHEDSLKMPCWNESVMLNCLRCYQWNSHAWSLSICTLVVFLFIFASCISCVDWARFHNLGVIRKRNFGCFAV